MKVGGRQVELLAVSSGMVCVQRVNTPLPCVHYSANRMENPCSVLVKFYNEKYVKILVLQQSGLDFR